MNDEQIERIFKRSYVSTTKGDALLLSEFTDIVKDFLLLAARDEQRAEPKPIAWRYDTDYGRIYHSKQLDHLYADEKGEYVKGVALYDGPQRAALNAPASQSAENDISILGNSECNRNARSGDSESLHTLSAEKRGEEAKDAARYRWLQRQDMDIWTFLAPKSRLFTDNYIEAALAKSAEGAKND